MYHVLFNAALQRTSTPSDVQSHSMTHWGDSFFLDPLRKTALAARLFCNLALCWQVIDTHASSKRTKSDLGTGTIYLLTRPIKIFACSSCDKYVVRVGMRRRRCTRLGLRKRILRKPSPNTSCLFPMKRADCFQKDQLRIGDER